MRWVEYVRREWWWVNDDAADQIVAQIRGPYLIVSGNGAGEKHATLADAQRRVEQGAPPLYRYHVVFGHSGGPHADAHAARYCPGRLWGSVYAETAEEAVRQVENRWPTGPMRVRSWWCAVYELEPRAEFQLHIIIDEVGSGNGGGQ